MNAMEPHLTAQTTADDLSISLIQLLSNTLILYQTTPHLPVSSLLALASTSKAFKNLIRHTPNVFRHLNLTKVKGAQFEIAAIDHGGEVWRNVQLDENLAEDEFYGGPLRGVFYILGRHHLLQDVRTLILDGLSVTADIVSDILTQPQYNVHILSIREVSNLNERKLQQALLYAVRPSRSAFAPKIQGIYFFGPKDAPPVPQTRKNIHNMRRYPAGIAPIDTLPIYGGVIYSRGAQIGAQWNEKSEDTLAEEMGRCGDKWFSGGGKVMPKIPSVEWSQTVNACQGIINFDVVMCNGPRHQITPKSSKKSSRSVWYEQEGAYLEPRIATHSIKGCHGCGSAPEMFSKFGVSPMDRFPLLAPPPLHSSTAKAAKAPFVGGSDRLLVRCGDCLRGRFCESCQKWWCEECYKIPGHPHSNGPPAEWQEHDTTAEGHPEKNLKVHMGLCVEDCLVSEMMSGAGSYGMWG